MRSGATARASARCWLVAASLAVVAAGCADEAELPTGAGGAGVTGFGGGGEGGFGGAGGEGGAGGDGGACADIDCAANAICDAGECLCEEGFYGDAAVSCEPVAELAGFIGSPCDSAADCDYADALCLGESDGYPNGYCSRDCSTTCPDAADHPATLCSTEPGAAASEGGCFSRCDLDAYPNSGGCRPHYRCLVGARPNDPGYQRPLCVPLAWTQDCADPANLAGDDDCYFAQVSFADPTLEQLSRQLLAGQASAAEALAFLDQNYALSQTYLEAEFGTVYPNYTPGHSASEPMHGMVVHYTANQRERPTINYFIGSEPHASTHFIVGSQRHGALLQLYPHTSRSWHAGDYNQRHFGIDFANAGYLNPSSGSEDWESYNGTPHWIWMPMHGDKPITVVGGIPGEAAKYAAYEEWQPLGYYQLLSYVLAGRALHKVYGLQDEHIVRHGDVSASRVDPGPQTPLTYLKLLTANDENVFATPWLNDYKQQPNWIADHPDAR